MAIDSMQGAINFRWGDIEDDDDFDFLLPAKQVIGPDQNGIKKVIEYKFNDEGKTVKITTTSRVQNRALSKQAVERRSWLKFGDAAHEDASSLLTMRSTEDIILERIRGRGNNAEESTASGDGMSQVGRAGAVLMVCRLCHMRGGHWTARCPQQDLLSLMDQPLTAETSGSDMRRRGNDENSVCVTNLSEDARELDLMELFSPFGHVSRFYVAIKGIGFVNFVSKEDAQRAINNLNGFGYDNLILRVEWATPRPY